MSSSKKRVLLGVGLLCVELGLFALLSYLLGLSTKETKMFSAIYIFILFLNHHYNFSPILIWQEIIEMIQSHTLFLGISLIISFCFKEQLTLDIIVLTLIMYCATILLNRAFRKRFRRFCATKVLMIGAGKNAEMMNDVVGNNGFLFMDVIGYVDTEPFTGTKPSSIPSIKDNLISIDEIKEVIPKNKIEEVLILDEHLSAEQLNLLTEKLHNRIPVIKYRPVTAIVQPYNTKVEDFDGNLFISVSDAKKKYVDIVLKKVVDIAAGLCGLIVLIPLTIIVKIVSVLNGDKDSIFFTQDRIGKNGEIIKIYKFRSMIPNAEQVLEELMEKDPKIKEEYLTNKKLDPDPRVTPIGNILRKTSLDEFPQFINVLKGDMSLIGPRPYLPREIEDMGKYYDTIIKSKPGISGMWQANGRSSISFKERCKLDVYYYDNWSFWLDLIIIVKTIKAVLRKEGAM